MSSGRPGMGMTWPGLILWASAFQEAYSMAAEQAPEVKKETIGMLNL